MLWVHVEPGVVHALWQPHLWHHLSLFTFQVNTVLILIQLLSPRGLLWEIPQHLTCLVPIPRVKYPPGCPLFPTPFLYPSCLTHQPGLRSSLCHCSYGAFNTPPHQPQFPFLLLGLSTLPFEEGSHLPLGMSPMEVLSLSPKLHWLFNQQTQEREGSSFFKQNGIRCVICFKKIFFWH